MRVGVLGGTFDPVHIGHLLLGEMAREQLSLERVLFIPTGQSWRKPQREITGGEHRLAMLRLATQDNPGFGVSSLEVDREGPSYTAVTLEALTERHPNDELFFILGRDALADLPNWHNPARIVELATLAVAERPNAEAPSVTETRLATLDARLASITMPAIGVTSTEIRERIAEGRSVRYQVPDSVSAYIRAHGLYAAPVS